MQVVAVQHEIVWQGKAASFRRVSALLQSVEIPPGSLIVLPEMFSTGYSMDVPAVAEGDDRPAERFLAELARSRRAHVIGGVVNQSNDGRGRNEAVVFDPSGAEVMRYQKVHPMSVSGEADAYERGGAPSCFTWHTASVAPLICYDLRFPELFRSAVRQGAEVLIVIANFPAARAEHWTALLIARAIENQCYAIGVNRCGSDPNYDYLGGSIIVDPRGQVIAEAGSDEAVLTAALDIAALREWRRDFPVLIDAGLIPPPPPEPIDTSPSQQGG